MLLRGMTAAALVVALARAAPIRGAPGDFRPDGAATPAQEPSVRLPVETRESDGNVRLLIRLPADVQPDSVELQLAVREIVVLARRTGGEEVRSGVILLGAPPSEDGVAAEVGDDGLLTVTLPKRPAEP
jgi:HSP20 family molecular chaperone IbpA